MNLCGVVEQWRDAPRPAKALAFPIWAKGHRSLKFTPCHKPDSKAIDTRRQYRVDQAPFLSIIYGGANPPLKRGPKMWIKVNSRDEVAPAATAKHSGPSVGTASRRRSSVRRESAENSKSQSYQGSVAGFPFLALAMRVVEDSIQSIGRAPNAAREAMSRPKRVIRVYRGVYFTSRARPKTSMSASRWPWISSGGWQPSIPRRSLTLEPESGAVASTPETQPVLLLDLAPNTPPEPAPTAAAPEEPSPMSLYFTDRDARRSEFEF